VATFSVVGDVVRAVAADRVEVRDLMPPGADPHRFRPAESDSALFPPADAVFRLGLGMEAYLEPLLDAVAADLPVVGVADRIPADLLRYPEALGGAADPHVWHDPQLWVWAVSAVTETLVELDLSHRSVYEANSQAFLEQIGGVDRYLADRLALLPAERRVLVSAHDAFGYLGARYGLETQAVLGVRTEPPATEDDVLRIADLVVDRGVPAVFPEVSVPLRGIAAVAEASAARGAPPRVGELLYSDGLGEPDLLESRYVGMMYHNVDAIVLGLALPPDVPVLETSPG
jgi:manganese/zinc/iron transport system substrate-binding protein